MTVTTEDGTFTDQVTVTVTENGPGTYFSTRLSGSPTEQYGLAKSLSVMPGDVVDIEVYAKYIDADPENWTPLLNNLILSLSIPSGGIFVDGGQPGSGGSPPPYTVPHDEEAGEAPKAYLNYIIIDRDFNKVIDMGAKPVTTAAKEYGQNGQHERLFFDDIVVREAGYMYIYISNEGEELVDVFFDDLKVTHVKSPIVQTNDYYPYGLTFNSYSRENSTPQDYLYNSKELQDELNLGWLDYGARMYMPEIGRFMKIDSRAHNYMMYSPYGYVVNNPTNNVDYNGDFILPKEFLNRFQRIAQYLANDIQGILENETIVRALKKHGGFSDRQLKRIFTWGQGPVVKPTESFGPGLETLGATGGTKDNPTDLLINIDLFEALEKAEGKDRDYWLFLIAVTILHETVHHGYIINGLTTETEEEGNDFEMDVYGEIIKERTGSHKRVMDEWLKRQEIRRSSSSSSSGPWLEFFWVPSNTSTTTSGKSKKEPDADRKSSKRSGGAH